MGYGSLHPPSWKMCRRLSLWQCHGWAGWALKSFQESSGTNCRVMALKAQAKLLAMVPQTPGPCRLVGIRPGPDPRQPLLRDGDLIPFSMTHALLASDADRCIPRPGKCATAFRCGSATGGWVGHYFFSKMFSNMFSKPFSIFT